MIENFKVEKREIDRIGKFSEKEKNFRVQNLNFFNENGFPNKRVEDWKFSDFKQIVSKNFNKLNINIETSKTEEFQFIKEFEHNYLVLINGKLNSSNFQFEEKEKVKVKNFFNDDFKDKKEINSLVNLNHALSNNGYILKVNENYKFKKILVIYNIFTKNLNEDILNIRNKIVIGKNSELHTIDFEINKSKNKFLYNSHESIYLNENSIYKNIILHNENNNGFFHRFKINKLKANSNYNSFIFPSGPKFNKLDLQFDLEGENCECNLQSASYIDQDDHQEIKTRINHLFPNCRSYQKVKNVLNSKSRGVFQGKIYVNDIAQKTNAYQLSKAILLSENSEFNSKPELEIYADDVKCSHGSTSGSIDENSIFYLMSRGLSRKDSVSLLVNGFLSEITDTIKSETLKKFIKKKLESGVNEYKKH